MRITKRNLAIFLAASFLPTTMLAGQITAAIYKKNNPDAVDITQGLAYLGQTMTIALAIAGLMIAGCIGLIVMLYRQDKNFSEARLPLVLLVVNFVLVLGIALTNNYVNQVQDQYLIDHGKPTLQQFFDAMEKQKNR